MSEHPSVTETPAPVEVSSSDPAALLDQVPLSESEARYVEAARAANTMRGYRSDWTEFTTWCTHKALEPVPAAPATLTGYLTDLAAAGAKVGTLSRRLSAIKFVHHLHNRPDPTTNARVLAVWEVQLKVLWCHQSPMLPLFSSFLGSKASFDFKKNPPTSH